MEIKRNDATRNRPDGSRIIDAPYVFMDIPAFADQLKNEKSWDKNDRNGITVFKSEEITMVLTALKAGAEIRNHTADVFFTLMVIQGEIVITTADVEKAIMKGQAIAFHPHILHSVKALSDATLLLTSYCRNGDC